MDIDQALISWDVANIMGTPAMPVMSLAALLNLWRCKCQS